MRAREQRPTTAALAPTAGSVPVTDLVSDSSQALSDEQLLLLAGGGFGFLLLGVGALAPSLVHIAGRRPRFSRTLLAERDAITTYGFAVLLITAAAYLVVSSSP